MINCIEGIQEAIIRNLPKNSAPFIIISITMVLTLLGSFPLLLLPCFEIVESKADKKENRFFVTDPYRFWTRTLQVLVIAVLGFFIPEFGSINAIIGSLTGVIVSQLIPAVLHLVVIKRTKGLWWWIEDWIIIVVFTLVMIICTGSSVIDLIHKLKNCIVCFILIRMEGISGDTYDLMCFEMVNQLVFSEYHVLVIDR